ncbi:hypothetical protein [Paenibacillus sp. NEAU-GSW1]|uniref:hypothetical protein n=1 Tax=Paenibacillus sp. NEAU-GSW1 TaxID=2682486 RepID=UPI0012E1428E|nr:hypothetical protein [Paenibacillus sp. NEAU-GSW1]MUT66047.1 hypothetical protein [Paenibacillus sp. NEAU-GSW1]
MAKARFTLTVTVEREINPRNYLPFIPLEGTDEERIAVDIEIIQDSHFLILDDDNAIYEVKGEIIQEDAK